MPVNNGGMIILDGVLPWYDGPEWNDIVADVFSKAAPEVEDRAKADAPWEDRTGAAREGLNASVNEVGDEEVALILAHTVEYGYWLEVIQNGAFAIIMPTLEREAPKIYADVAKAVANARHGVNYSL